MDDNIKSRILYPDVCKFIAMFAVTMGHCSQAISGEQYSNIFGGTGLLVAFHMPLFMLLSGWFLNFDKIRETGVWPFLKSKALRLMLPSLAWCLIYNALSFRLPSVHTLLFFYWFLTALFLCQVIILLVAKLIKNNTLACVACVLFSLLLFQEDLSRVNFMMPFIIIGYSIRKVVENRKYTNPIFWISLVISIALSFYWSNEYTVYEQPFIFTEINKMMCLSFFYRLAIGTSISLFTICLTVQMSNSCSIYKALANLGNMTLVMYTFSFVLNAIFSKILTHFNCLTNEYLVIDLLSICLTAVICVLTYLLVSVCRKNKIMNLILCGEIKM